MGTIPGQEEPLEKEMATHSSILAWEIQSTEGAGRPAIQALVFVMEQKPHSPAVAPKSSSHRAGN